MSGENGDGSLFNSKCDACGETRGERKLKVISKDWSYQYGLPKGSVTRNYVFCNDNPVCADRISKAVNS